MANLKLLWFQKNCDFYIELTFQAYHRPNQNKDYIWFWTLPWMDCCPNKLKSLKLDYNTKKVMEQFLNLVHNSWIGNRERQREMILRGRGFLNSHRWQTDRQTFGILEFLSWLKSGVSWQHFAVHILVGNDKKSCLAIAKNCSHILLSHGCIVFQTWSEMGHTGQVPNIPSWKIAPLCHT